MGRRTTDQASGEQHSGDLRRVESATLDKRDSERQGRPRLETKRLRELLEVAAEVFIAQGFESASTNEIARRANASKTTFYSRFPTKEILFREVIEYRMNEVFSRITPTLPLEGAIEETLRAFAMSILQAALSPSQIELIRMVSMESKRFPELGRRFYELGAGRGKALLAEYLEEQTRRGVLRADNPQIMAEHFISLVIGGPVHWYVLGFQATMPKAKERVRHVSDVVTVFLRAYGHQEARQGFAASFA